MCLLVEQVTQCSAMPCTADMLGALAVAIFTIQDLVVVWAFL
jgi:hypothetical protein